MSSLTREQLTTFIERHGGRVATSVSRKTDLLIVGENPGENKLRDAHAKGVPTLWWGFGEWLGLFSTRDGRGELDISAARIVSALADNMATIVEDLYIRHPPPSGLPFHHASHATAFLLLLAWGSDEDGPVRVLPTPTEHYLSVRNGRSDEQLMKDMSLVLEVLTDLHEAVGSNGTRYVLQEWLNAITARPT